MLVSQFDENGQYFQWYPDGQRYYVKDYGLLRARRMAFSDGAAARLAGNVNTTPVKKISDWELKKQNRE